MQQQPTRESGDPSLLNHPHHQSSICKPNSRARLRLQLTQLIAKLPTDTQWNFSSKRYPPAVIREIFERVEDHSKVQRLYLHWNEKPELVRIPAQYALPQLKVLNIGGNNIASIELLQRADFRSLEQLWLWFNQLTRVDALRKCSFPALRLLDLSDNHLLEFPALSQMDAPCLARINIEKNGFTHLRDFAKTMIDCPGSLTLLFTANHQLSKVFEWRRRKGAKACNILTYTRTNGKPNIKLH